jgi:hypothetical protein
MATCITQGRTRSCSTAISGGCNFLYLVDYEDVDSVTIAASGDASGIVMNPISAVFFKFQFAPNTAVFTESITNENCATQVTQTFAMNWNGRNQTDTNSIMDLAGCCSKIRVFLGFGGIMKQKKYFCQLLKVLLELRKVTLIRKL